MFLYNTFTFFVSLLIVPFFLLSPRGRERLGERFGKWGGAIQEVEVAEVVWFHGASAGEVRGLLPLLPLFQELYPGVKSLLTVTSPTAMAIGEKSFDEVHLLPFDNQIWLQRAINGRRLVAFVNGETELWPALLSFLNQQRVAIYLVNARISDATASRYRLLSPFFRPLLKNVRVACVADKKSAERLSFLGVPRSALKLTGNAKYDAQPKISSGEEANAVRSRYFTNNDPVLVLGSVRPGEEVWWFDAIKKRLDAGGKFNVVVAPRHKEKFDFFADRLKTYGLPFTRWSDLETSERSDRIVLVDTFGQLEGAYSFASLAFIGATLVDVGGHNPLEACRYSVPVAMGPYYFVVEGIVNDLLAQNAILLLEKQRDVMEAVRLLDEGRDQLRQMGARGKEVNAAHVGATSRIAEAIHESRQDPPATTSNQNRA